MPEPQIHRLKPGYESLGLVIDFLTQEPPFARYAAGVLAAAVKYQLGEACHLALVEDGRLTGYLGWLMVTRTMGEAWIAGDLAEPRPVPHERADAIALTVIRVARPQSRPLLIGPFRRAMGERRIFYKRHYASGRKRLGALGVTAPWR